MWQFFSDLWGIWQEAFLDTVELFSSYTGISYDWSFAIMLVLLLVFVFGGR